MKIELKTIFGELIIEGDFSSIADAVQAAAGKKSLSYANLSSANLRYANLSYANLGSADLSSANLRYANLSYANLGSADLSYADLSSANLSSANLRYANLSYANLSSANLSSADLGYANLSSADLSSADLSSANLSSANLRYANLSYANLSYANLSSANLRYAKNSELSFAQTRILPAGTLIVWKSLRGGIVAKLRIPDAAKRSHAFGRKCRAEYAEVIEMFQADGTPFTGEGTSAHDIDFKYRVGETVKPEKPFSDDWQNECESGIHFFITREEAADYAQ